MNDELEPRLRDAFRNASLPAAPASLVEALERVPDAPVVRRRSGRSVWAPLAVAALLVVAGAVAIGGGQRGVVPGPTAAVSVQPSAPASTPVEGLLRVEYQIQPGGAAKPNAADVAAMVAIVRQRLDSFGVEGASVRAQAEDRLIVELQAASNTDAVRYLIGQTGRVDFVPLGMTSKDVGDRIDPGEFPALFGGDQIESAAVAAGQAGERVVSFVLKPDGARLFGDYTATHIGQYFAIVIDSRVVSAPVINSAIPGGEVEISSGGPDGMPLDEARGLVAVLESGSLPYPLLEISSEIIQASPGQSPAGS